jgi:hypothetical protein
MTQDQVKLNDAVKLLCFAISFIDEMKYEANDDVRLLRCTQAHAYLNMSLDDILSNSDTLPPGKE